MQGRQVHCKCKVGMERKSSARLACPVQGRHGRQVQYKVGEASALKASPLQGRHGRQVQCKVGKSTAR